MFLNSAMPIIGAGVLNVRMIKGHWVDDPNTSSAADTRPTSAPEGGNLYLNSNHENRLTQQTHFVSIAEPKEYS